MRNLRTALVASATAVALSLSATAAVSAEETAAETKASTSTSLFGTNDPAYGTALYGEGKEAFSSEPGWAQVMYFAGVFGVLGSLAGLGIAAMNQLKAQGLIR